MRWSFGVFSLLYVKLAPQVNLTLYINKLCLMQSNGVTLCIKLPFTAYNNYYRGKNG